MFTQPAPAPPTLATSTSSASPASPTRTGRLRGLSYLRSYTHTHLLSRDSTAGNPSSRPSSYSRTNSLPSPAASPTAAVSSASPSYPADRGCNSHASADSRRSNTDPLAQDAIVPTGGWLPASSSQNGVTRVPADPQSVTTSTSTSSITSSLAAATAAAASATTNGTESPGMVRTRSASGQGATGSENQETSTAAITVQSNMALGGATTSVPATSRQATENLPSIRFTAHQDLRSTDRGPPRPSLVFSPMARTLPTGTEIIRVGRYSERDNVPQQSPNIPSAAPVGFKSKVVSRRHCEFWCQNGRWFIKDVKSSSGTFLNHVRLSAPGAESKPFPVNDGDIVQLGIDFKGGEEMIFRCVKIRIELNRGWQNSLNTFNLQSHKRLRDLRQQVQSAAGNPSQDCSICLSPVAPCQSLFVAPCSHTWHYKCVRVIINGPSWPQFVCPNCRAVADLEAEIDDPYEDADWEEIRALEAEQAVEATQTEGLASAPSMQVREPTVLAEPAPSPSEVPITVPPPSNTLQEQRLADPNVSGAPEVQASASNAVDEEPLGHPLEPMETHTNHTVSDSAITVPIPIPQTASASSQRYGSAHATGPLDIETSSTSSASSDAMSRTDENRTPSPAGRAISRTRDIVSEGPMTPRNDVGPFVFDGSAGRAGGAAMASLIHAASPPLEHGNSSQTTST